VRVAGGDPADSAGADDTAPGDDEDGGGPGTGSRRRRRGGRGRGKGGPADGGLGDDGTPGQAGPASGAASADGGGQDGAARSRPTGARQDGGRSAGHAASSQVADGQDEESGADGDGSGTGSASRRRRRRRQRGGTPAVAVDATAPDDPSDTVVHVRPARSATETDDVRAVKGSTRLEAKRQRRREGRDSGRRRPPIISESEFLARREAVERVMVVRQQGERTQIAVLEDEVLVEHYVDKASHQSYVGNVYLGKVQNVLPSMEAAFVDIGKGRNAVLYAGEVNFDASGLEGVAKRIESALKSGQSIMVQVTKDPIGHKGARLTSQVSLPGRYLVYVPGASMTGISRKLPDTERTRLKQILKKVAPEDGGIIVRTAAEGASEEELVHDVTRLVAQWQAIERKAKSASAPDLLYSEPDLTIRVVRDIFNEDFTKLVIASDSEWDLVDEYVRYVAPSLADRMERWSDDADLFAAYRIDEQLAKALDRKVWLPSGGSLVIDTTEAMTVIDVNTGKFTGQGGNLEQTVTRNNLEAAEEIVRQLRLRDIGGIIVIDFIDMVLESNRELVLRRLIECLARDRTKHQVAEVTSLGLVQMTRKRVGSGLLAAFSVPCEHCNGRGVLVSVDLTDHPQPPGRGNDRAASQPAGPPKPGPARSRAGRSRAAAATAGGATPGSIGPAAESADVAAEPVSSELAKVERGSSELVKAERGSSELAKVERGSSELVKAERGSSGQVRTRRGSHGVASPDLAGAEPGNSEANGSRLVAAEPGSSGPDGAEPDGAEPDAAVAAPRRRNRRSAQREAGPPAHVTEDGAAPVVTTVSAGTARSDPASGSNGSARLEEPATPVRTGVSGSAEDSPAAAISGSAGDQPAAAAHENADAAAVPADGAGSERLTGD
jgi:ribonuclease E